MFTKSQLIEAISRETSQPMTVVERILAAQGRVLAHQLSAGRETLIPGVGRLQRKQRAARKGINPSTKQAIDIPAKNVAVFKAAKELRDAIA